MRGHQWEREVPWVLYEMGGRWSEGEYAGKILGSFGASFSRILGYYDTKIRGY